MIKFLSLSLLLAAATAASLGRYPSSHNERARRSPHVVSALGSGVAALGAGIKTVGSVLTGGHIGGHGEHSGVISGSLSFGGSSHGGADLSHSGGYNKHAEIGGYGQSGSYGEAHGSGYAGDYSQQKGGNYGHSEVGLGIAVGGHASGGHGGIVAADQSHLSESGYGSSSGIEAGSSGYATGSSSKVSSSKSSSSESNKSSKRKSESNFAAGGESFSGGAYDASKASQLDYAASAVGGGGFHGASQVGLSSKDVASQHGQSFGASSGYASGSSNTEVEESESSKHSESESNSSEQSSFASGGSDYLSANKQGAGYNKDVKKDRYIRIRRSPQFERFSMAGFPNQGFNYGGFAASKDRLSQSSQGSSSGMVAGQSGFSTGKTSSVGSSKSSSSESNKASKIKTGTTFGGAGQSVASNAYDASKASELNYGASSIGGGVFGVGMANVGLSSKDASQVNQQSLGASSNYLSGNSNTEIEQTQSDKHSESETNEAVDSTYANAGSAYGQAQQSNYAQNKQVNNEGIYGVGAGGLGIGKGVVAAESSQLSASASGASSGIASGSDAYATGTANRKSSSKSSSSESSKGTKIKSGTNFGYGNSNLQAQQYAASQSGNLNYGANVAGFGGLYGIGSSQVGLSKNSASNERGQSLASSAGYLQGVSNTEVEESESNKQSQSETNEQSQSSYAGGNSQFGAAQESSSAQKLNAENSSLYSSK